MIEERGLRDTVNDMLLAAMGIPTASEALKLLEDMHETVKLLVAVRGKPETIVEDTVKLLKSLEERYERISVRLLEASSLPEGMPQPCIVVTGRLEGRYRFYGHPGGLLLSPFLLAVAAAGAAWEPPGRNEVDPGLTGRALLYVVPGLPCVRAMYYGLQVVYHSRAELDVANVESMLRQGLPVPVKAVPAWRTACGELKVLTPRRTRDAVAMWNCGRQLQRVSALESHTRR